MPLGIFVGNNKCSVGHWESKKLPSGWVGGAPGKFFSSGEPSITPKPTLFPTNILLNYSRCLGATKFQTYRTIVIPYILPNLNGSIRVILGISFALVLAGELLATDRGLGWLMILSERYLQTGRMMVIVIIFIIYTIILNTIFIKLSNKVNHWKN